MIVVLGASGYVGSAITSELRRQDRETVCLSRAETDYTRISELESFLRSAQPEFLINAAGYTGVPNVDACELHKGECLAGNSVLPATIRAACEATKTRWGHISSGCIYTGTKPDGSGFTEQDTPNFSFRTDNCSFYSGTKALGEEVLAGADCYVWRLRIPFNHEDGRRNYLTKLLRYNTLLDATNSLSCLNEFSRAVIDSYEKKIPFGIYNLTNSGGITTRDVVRLIQASGIVGDREFKFFDSESEFMRIAAKTPRSNCVLDNSKAREAGLKLSNVEDAIRRALRDWEPETSAETTL